MTLPETRGVRVVFLGGQGEIGRNMIAVESDDRMLVIDAGLSFPNEEMLGVDLVLPDFSYVTERAARCEAVILTHGHEDHVGALSWLLRDLDVPVYGTALTLGLARRRLDEAGVAADMVTIEAGTGLTLGPFGCRFLAVSHSIPDAIGVALETTEGRILYTGDFKLDDAPVDGRKTDLAAFRELGDLGVDLLLSDSTNAERPGRTPSESVVGAALAEIFAGASGRIVLACFASNLHRVQQVCRAAEDVRRKVAFVGRSMIANVEVGLELGHIRVRRDSIVDIADADRLRRDELVVVCTGSQGEPFSALSRIAAGEHKFVRVERGDTVILSATPIPGNEAAVHRVLNAFYRSGAEVFHSETSDVHVSGHAAAGELAEMISTVRPRHFVPVHGEFRHLAVHAKIAQECGLERDRISLVEDGDVLQLEGGAVTRGERVPVGTILVDGLGVGDVGPVVLRDRRHLAGDGFIVCVVTIDGRSGEVLDGPALITRGFIYEDESRAWLDEAHARADDALRELERDKVTDWSAIKKACRHAVGEYVWQSTRRRPMILPIVMEV